jgi:mRNA interferase MazF
MGRFVKGEVVTFPFPFSDLTGNKRRPSLVVANLPGDDMILCMITSYTPDGDAIRLEAADFSAGGLPADPCFIRPARLFTGEDKLVVRSKGQLRPAKLREVTNKIIEIVSRP